MASINDLATAATIASSAVRDNTAPSNPSATPESPRSEKSGGSEDKDMEEAVRDEIRVRDSSPPIAEETSQTKDATKQSEEPSVEKPSAGTASPDAAPDAASAATAASATPADAATQATDPVAVQPATPEASKVQIPQSADTNNPQEASKEEEPGTKQPAVDSMEGVEHTSSSTTAADMATTAAIAADATVAAAAAFAATAAADSDSIRDKAREREERDRLKTKPVRGAFIVFEGMDRAGKTTQAKLLQQRCIESGRAVTFMRFPDRTTTIGQMINAYLQGEAEIEDHVIHLLFTANRWEAAKKIRAALSSGRSIICDRFYHSGIVYSAAKQLPSLSLSWAKNPEIGLPRPDMVLFLDLEEETARKRGGWGGEVYEKGEMQRRVRELFWGLSMGDLGSSGGGAASGNGGTYGHSRRRSSSINHLHHHPNEHARRMSVASGGAGNNHHSHNGGGGEDTMVMVPDKPFGQEEEDIQIVDAALGVEEMSEKVWEVVLPKLEEVEKGDSGKEVRTVN